MVNTKPKPVRTLKEMDTLVLMLVREEQKLGQKELMDQDLKHNSIVKRVLVRRMKACSPTDSEE